jgi:hypothetical protein
VLEPLARLAAVPANRAGLGAGGALQQLLRAVALAAFNPGAAEPGQLQPSVLALAYLASAPANRARLRAAVVSRDDPLFAHVGPPACAAPCARAGARPPPCPAPPRPALTGPPESG